MIDSTYSILYDLVRKGDLELSSIFRQHGAQPQSDLSDDGGDVLQMITLQPTSYDLAKDKMDKVLGIIRDGGDDLFKSISELQEILQDEGIMKLIMLLHRQQHCDDESLVNDFLSPFDHLQSLFKGVPLFRIVVEDARPCDSQKGKGGRYDIYLEERKSNTRYLIPFENNEAKALYLLFLMHPRIEVGKNRLKSEDVTKQLIHIYEMAFYGLKNFASKVEWNDGKPNPNFDKFLSYNKAAANRNISSVLGKRDNEEWYIISLENDKYALSLLDDFIVLPNSLKTQNNKR